MIQRCGRCKLDKPIEAFSPSYRGKPGTWCRECFRAYARGDRAPSLAHEPRKCNRCGVAYTPKQVKAGDLGLCSRKCKEAVRRESGRDREHHLIRKYGITSADYDRMLKGQGGHCALCPVSPEEIEVGRYRTFFHVDHDHGTGRVRGLLCPDCNLKLGRVTGEWMRAALAYIA